MFYSKIGRKYVWRKKEIVPYKNIYQIFFISTIYPTQALEKNKLGTNALVGH